MMELDTGVTKLALEQTLKHELDALSRTRYPALPQPAEISTATNAIVNALPEQGIGTERATQHLLKEIAPGLNGSSLSSTYFGLVTGGATPAAKVADHLTTLYDQNCPIHLPEQTIATIIESKASAMLADLLRLDHRQWPVRLLTTGATAGNILGLVCGRQWVLEKRLTAHGQDAEQAADAGLLKACNLARISGWQILTSLPHSSLRKAANIVGIGAASVIDVGVPADLLTFDMNKLEEHLAQQDTASIVVISCGEVNTGWFATHSLAEVTKIRELCDRYGAWLHVDGAFGIFARCLKDCGPEFERVVSGALGMELADSVSGDGHKMLNVPYDCGFFFNKHLGIQQRVCQNSGAAYLSAKPGDIPSPLNLGLENSKRLRGLPLYATLIASGRSGYIEMVRTQVLFARAVAKYIASHPDFVLLPTTTGDYLDDIFMIVLFRAKNPQRNETLVHDIIQTREVYVSGTVWDGQPAARIAVSNWQTNVENDLQLVTEVLDRVIKQDR